MFWEVVKLAGAVTAVATALTTGFKALRAVVAALRSVFAALRSVLDRLVFVRTFPARADPEGRGKGCVIILPERRRLSDWNRRCNEYLVFGRWVRVTFLPVRKVLP